MTIPVNVWTISVALTLALLWWANREIQRNRGGSYDFTGPFIALAAVIGVVALWTGVILSRFL